MSTVPNPHRARSIPDRLGYRSVQARDVELGSRCLSWVAVAIFIVNSLASPYFLEPLVALGSRPSISPKRR